MDTACTSCAYTHTHFLSHVRALPWSLAIGDVGSNLNALEQSEDAVHHPVGKKIKRLLNIKYNRAEVEEAVIMLRECRWSTAFAEQLHAHASVLHKLHREYGEETLCARAMVSFMKLLTSVDPIAHAEEKARKTLTLLSRKNPERASARSQLLGEFSHEVKELSASSRTMSEHETRSSFVEGGKAWASLGPDQKRSLEAASGSSVRAKRARLESDKLKVKSDLSLLKDRAAKEKEQDGVQSRVSACRLSEAWRQRLQQLWETLTDIPARRRRAMTPLGPPTAQLVHDMGTVQLPQADGEDAAPAQWCKQLCKHRSLFSQCILEVSSRTATKYYYFLYASQSPQDICMAPLQVTDTHLEASSGSSSRAFEMPSDVHCPTFTFALGEYISGRKLALDDSEYLYVIPFARWNMGSPFLTADLRDSVYYVDYLKGVPDPAPAKGAGSSSGRTKDQNAMLKAHSWLQSAMDKKRKPIEEESEEEEVAPEEAAMAADIVEAVMARLALKHPELEELHGQAQSDFHVVWRRDYDNRGGSNHEADSVRGVCLSSGQEFCRAHGLNQSATFRFVTCGGEVGAHRLAQEWCRRMQHLKDAFQEASAGQLDWAVVCTSYHLDDSFESWVKSCEIPHVQARAQQIANLMRP